MCLQSYETCFADKQHTLFRDSNLLFQLCILNVVYDQTDNNTSEIHVKTPLVSLCQHFEHGLATSLIYSVCFSLLSFSA